MTSQQEPARQTDRRGTERERERERKREREGKIDR